MDSQASPQRSGNRLKPLWITAGILLLLVVGVLFVGSWNRGWRKMVAMDCAHQLSLIGAECRVYAERHAGHYPDKWADLGPNEDNGDWIKLFCCPSGGHEAGAWTNVDLWADYHLIPGRTTNDPVSQILAVENLVDHPGGGANVLHVDGTTRWVPVSLLLTNTAR